VAWWEEGMSLGTNKEHRHANQTVPRSPTEAVDKRYLATLSRHQEVHAPCLDEIAVASVEKESMPDHDDVTHDAFSAMNQMIQCLRLMLTLLHAALAGYDVSCVS